MGSRKRPRSASCQRWVLALGLVRLTRSRAARHVGAAPRRSWSNLSCRSTARSHSGFRSSLLPGLVVFGPVAVTAYIVWWAINTVDNWVRPWFPNLWPDGYLPFHVPGFGAVIAIIGLTLLRFPDRELHRPLAGRSVCVLRDRRRHAAGKEADGLGVHAVYAQPATAFFFWEVVELPISADDTAMLIMATGLTQRQCPAALAAMAQAAGLDKAHMETKAEALDCQEPRRPVSTAAYRSARAGACLGAVRGRKLC